MKYRHVKSIRRYLFLAVAVAYYVCLPDVLFEDPYSTVLEDKEGKLLGASIAGDGQWRFPETDTIPKKFLTALVTFEDQRFYYHPGVDLLSMGRALQQNIKAGRVVSGGSTLSMQVIRLMRKGESRTVWEKCIEMILATRLELHYSKKEILAIYASHAPFGGNVVGIEAACWRYFGREPGSLSWGEASMLAVLPNAPSLIHPGRNRTLLVQKRNFLLDKLRDTGAIDSLTCALAKAESIPDHPQSLPRNARHLLARAAKEGHAQQKIRTTVDQDLQARVEQIIAMHHERLQANQIFNAAALVLHVETGEVLAYVGNTDIKGSQYYGDEVDVITAPRSTGSILKPFLYAAMFDEGKILPNTLLPDVPTIIAGFAPKNFSHEYDGAVPASNALIRSLNIPAVYLLREYRYEKFHSLLQHLGMTTLTYPPDHYGLSLILGGAEGSLWDITGMYASMARTLNHYFEHPGKNKYNKSDYFAPAYLSQVRDRSEDEEYTWLSAAAVYQTFDILKELYRPGEGSGWKHFESARKIAWKTGTSFGFRDGWAVGVTPEYVVGVWTGNADGEGRPGLTGTEAAAPILFDIYSQLPGRSWFSVPVLEMEQAVVCQKSGMRINESCPQADTMRIVNRGLQTLPCPYHRQVHLSADEKFRVNSACAPVSQMRVANWFVLPPVQAYYFRSKNITYKPLPPMRSDCQPSRIQQSMDLVYPTIGAKIFIPRELSGNLGGAVFELAHHNPGTPVYWHLDGLYIGTTQRSHYMTVQCSTGKHVLTLVDAAGETLERSFEVVSSGVNR